MILQADITLSNVRDGTSVKIKGICLGHYKTKSEFLQASGLADGIYLIDEGMTAFIKKAQTSSLLVEVGDGYMMSSENADLDGHLWMASTDAWIDCGKIKGEDGRDGINGQNGQNGQNAVHFELRDNGSVADIRIVDGKIKLSARLTYDLYRVDGTTETKATGTVTNGLDGGTLTYSNGHYTRTISKEYTAIDSLPATVTTTAKFNNTVVATAVCKVTMSNAAYWDVDNKLGTITARVQTAEGNISTLFSDGKSIRASIQSISNPNMLLNSGFGLGSGGVPEYWEIWDDNKKNPTVRTQNADECVVTVKEAGNFQGVSQTRKMILHSPLRLTFSCWAKGNGLFTVLLHKRDGTNIKQEVYTQQLGSGYTKQVVAQFLIDSVIDSWELMLGFRTPAAGDSVTFRNPKLEMGDTATAYCENGNDRVLATGMDIESGKVEFTANKFNIRDNYGNQMFAVETGGTGGTASRVKLRNLAMSGLAIRDMVTMETWGDVRKYFTFDTKELTSGLRFETCLNTFRLSKRDGKSCLLGREEGETADSIKMFNVLLPCQDYFEPATDEYLAYMEEAMRYVGNRIVILNESGYRIAVYGRQEVTHMTTYTVWDSDSSTPAKAAPTTSTKPQDLRPVKDWDGSAQGYYIPTDKIHDQKREYTMQKVWTSDEYWVVPDGSMAVMECVCDICAPYDAQGATVSILEQPPMGQSVFWNVRVGKILKING